MSKTTLLGAIFLVLAICGYGTVAQAGCVDFRETPTGEALLINHCNIEVSVGYFVGAAGGSLDQSGHLYRSSVAAGSSKLLWTRANAPIPGRYQIKVFSCTAPTDLIFQPGNPPTCQIGIASEG